MSAPSNAGFTLIELVMVILLLAILAAVAIPNFIDMRTEAKNAATYGALGAFRSAVAIARAAIALRELETRPPYPTAIEMQANAFNGSHPVLSGKAILDDSAGKPVNPWSRDTAAITDKNRVYDCTGDTKGDLLNSPNHDQGWCYSEDNGQIWANSNLNGGSGTTTENNF